MKHDAGAIAGLLPLRIVGLLSITPIASIAKLLFGGSADRTPEPCAELRHSSGKGTLLGSERMSTMVVCSKSSGRLTKPQQSHFHHFAVHSINLNPLPEFAHGHVHGPLSHKCTPLQEDATNAVLVDCFPAASPRACSFLQPFVYSSNSTNDGNRNNNNNNTRSIKNKSTSKMVILVQASVDEATRALAWLQHGL